MLHPATKHNHAKRPKTAVLIALVCAIALPMPLPAAPPVAVPDAADTSVYRIQSDDVLDISLLGEGDMTRQVTVLPDGTISYPYTPDLPVRGLTLADLRQKLVKALSRQYVNPRVTVSVVRHLPPTLSIVGAVKAPGAYPVSDGMRVLDALGASGGLTVTRPDFARALLLRKGGATPVELDVKKLFAATSETDNPEIGPGDTLILMEKAAIETQVQLIGEVLRQGAYTVTESVPITYVLSLAGGVTPNAALSKAVIRRGPLTIPVNLYPLLRQEVMTSLAPATGARTETLLQPGDTLIIPANDVRFAVVGAVNKPGPLPYPEDREIDVLEAIFLAGGQTAAADLKNVILVRPAPVNKTTVSADASIKVNLWDAVQDRAKGKPVAVALPKIKPGDILWIPDKGGRQRSSAADYVPLLGAMGWLFRR